MKKLLIAGFVGAAIWYAQANRQPEVPRDSPPARVSAEDLQPEREIPATTFTCDGRTRCPQMRSCEEAEFFLKNCPNVRMDGDTDGVPCEDQHCSHYR